MSPEQARGDQVDFRSDIYALGIVVFELFTGTVPFRGETPVATLFKHIQDPPPIEGRRGIPPRLVPILKRALAKDPAARFDSARAMAEALREGLAEERERASHPTVVFDVPTVVGAAADEPPDIPAQTVVASRVPPRRAAVVTPKAGWRAAPILLSGLAAAALLGALLMAPWREDAETETSSAPAVSIAGSATLAPAPATLATIAPPVMAPPALPTAIVTARPPVTTAPAPRRTPDVATARPAPVAVAPPVTSPPAAAGTGTVRLRVLPWAEVEVDGEPRGTTPLRPLSMSAGSHVLRFVHPDYRPLIRRIAVRANETTTVEVDLARDAFPR